MEARTRATVTLPATQLAKGPTAARDVYRLLIRRYLEGTVTAVGIVFSLAYLGLEFSGREWIYVLAASPIGVAMYFVPDVFLIRRDFAPVRKVLAKLDAGENPTREESEQAMVAALNLPFASYVRVTLIHGPVATLAIALILIMGNVTGLVEFEKWQILIFAALVIFFAAPSHAIFEFFSVSKAMVPVVERLYPYSGEIGREHATSLKSTSIRSRLLYLAIFVSTLPLIFFAASVVFKIDRLLAVLGAEASTTQWVGLYQWIIGVVLVCVAGAFALTTLTATEVSRKAARLIAAMNRVEQGDLDVHLEVTGTDEYADLFRGFNLMTEGLREEVQILELSQALMGELNLDVLIQRIIRTTTELLDADRSTLFLYDPKTNELWSRFAQGLNTREVPLARAAAEESFPAKKEIRFPANQGIAGAVFTTGKVENIADPHADPRFNPEIDRLTGYRTESILAMPITTKFGERIGVTQVLNKRGGRFTTRDEARLRAFTAQIAVSLENARLFEDVLRMKNYNESILRSTSNGMITLDKERRIQTANDASLAILKTTPAFVIGQTAEEIFGARNQWVVRSIETVEATGETDIAVDADLVVGNSSASVNLTAVPLIDTAKEHIGSLLILEDITSEKRIRSTMSRYMSKEVADQLLEGGEAVLGGRAQRVSILFSDIRSFTTVSESLGAKDTVKMLNEYFADMVEVIFHHKGILDKYIGDAIMALFGAPFNGPKDADNAVAAANDMMVTLRALNERRHAVGQLPIDIGVGISTGEVVVGNIGSPKRMEYTAIGDSVNLASRLEGVTKMYGAKVLISEFTLRDMKEPSRVREIDLMRVKGKLQPVAVYEALDHFTEDSFPHLDDVINHYTRGMELYKTRAWSAAIAEFEKALAIHPEDKPTHIYLDRARHYAAVPPPPDWDRVWTLTEK